MSTISRWERGLLPFSADRLIQLMVTVGLPLDSLAVSYREFLETYGLQPTMAADLPELPAFSGPQEPAPVRVHEKAQVLGSLAVPPDMAAVRLENGTVLLLQPYWAARTGDTMLVNVRGRLALGRLQADHTYESCESGAVYRGQVTPLGVVRFFLMEPSQPALRQMPDLVHWSQAAVLCALAPKV